LLAYMDIHAEIHMRVCSKVFIKRVIYNSVRINRKSHLHVSKVGSVSKRSRIWHQLGVKIATIGRYFISTFGAVMSVIYLVL
jgi:hypothetical protein